MYPDNKQLRVFNFYDKVTTMNPFSQPQKHISASYFETFVTIWFQNSPFVLNATVPGLQTIFLSLSIDTGIQPPRT